MTAKLNDNKLSFKFKTTDSALMTSTVLRACEYLWSSGRVSEINFGSFAEMTEQQKLDLLNDYILAKIISFSQQKVSSEYSSIASTEAQTYIDTNIQLLNDDE